MLQSFKINQRAALCALALFFCNAPHAEAAPNAEQMAAYEAAPEMERVRLLLHLAKSGQDTDAAYMLHKFPLTGPYAKNRTLYIEGLILKAQGDLTGAAKKFRAALADDPSLTLVRADLAEVLVALEEDESAKHQLKLLAADAPNEAAANGIRSFIEQVDSRSPFKTSGYISFAPSTNLNNGSRHTTVYTPFFGSTGDINKTSQASSGLGVAAGLSAGYTKRLGNDFSFVAAGSADARVYDDSDFNSYSLSQSLELRRLISQGYLGFGAISSQSLADDKLGFTYAAYGPRLSASLQLSGKDFLSSSAVYEWRNKLAKGSKDATAIMLDGAFTHGFNSSFSTTLFGGWDKIASDAAQESYRTMSGGLSVYKELTHGITATVTGQIADTNFVDYNMFFLTHRKDTKLTGSISLTKRDLNLFGFAPSIYYSYTDNFSNINLYDYNSHAVDFRLTKDF
jgi:outer membrane protein